MGATFRKSMGLLHTWAGVVIGSLLFAIFWMGTLSVFDREIDRWMMPDTRLEVPTSVVSLDAMVRPVAEQLASGSPQWTINLPTERAPAIGLNYRDASGRNIRRHIDAATGKLAQDQGTHGGTGFIFPFHYSLHIKWKDVGYWLVGLAGMSMLAMLVSGVVIHKKIFREFFTFRPKKHVQRASLDLHNLTGVLALPFHFMVALSGLLIFFSIYFPWSVTAAYQGNKAAMFADVYGTYNRPKAGTPAPPASLDAMVKDAEARWSARLGEPARADFVRVVHPGDAAGFVQVRRIFPERTVTMDSEIIVYDAVNGSVLKEHYAAPVRSAHAFLAGMHFIQFKHWTLRWLYFLAGLSGCIMIATGFLFWLEARRARHAKQGLAGVRLVEGLLIGSVTGIVIATLTFFVINRLLPLNIKFVGVERAALEMWAFYLVWIATFAHAWLRPGQSWREQTRAIAALSLLAVLLNWITTGANLPQAIAAGHRASAGMDLMLLGAAVLAIMAARRLGRRDDAISSHILIPRTRRLAATKGKPVSATQEGGHG